MHLVRSQPSCQGRSGQLQCTLRQRCRSSHSGSSQHHLCSGECQQRRSRAGACSVACLGISPPDGVCLCGCPAVPNSPLQPTCTWPMGRGSLYAIHPIIHGWSLHGQQILLQADSIECFDAAAYRSASPASTYAFIRHLVRSALFVSRGCSLHCILHASCDALQCYTKTRQLLAAASVLGKQASACIEDVTPDGNTKPVGSGFSAWLDNNTQETDVIIVGAGMAGRSCA